MELAKERLEIDYSCDTALDDTAIVQAAFDRMELSQLLKVQKKLREVILARQSAILADQKKITYIDAAFESLSGEEKIKIEEHLASFSEVISFDVRGTVFKISMKRLMKYEGSYFHAMLSSGRFEPDHDGHYYIDRDPTLFKVILDFMESDDGVMDTGMLSKIQLAQLDKDKDYFQLKSPFAKWKWNEVDVADCCTISNEGLTVTVNTNDYCSIIGTHAGDRYSVKIDNEKGSLSIGFASKLEFDENSLVFDCDQFRLFYPSGLYIDGCLFRSIAMENVITVVRQGNFLTFEKNGISCRIGPLTELVPETDLLYPLISIYGGNGTQVTIIA